MCVFQALLRFLKAEESGSSIDRVSAGVARRNWRFTPAVLAAAVLLGLGSGQALASGAATTTALTAASGGTAVSSGGSITSPAQLTLTATVLAGSTAVTRGTVNFCVSGAAVCSDVNFIGTAQLTSAGTASYTFVPAIGAHSYVAVYTGTTTNATSASSAYNVTVTGGYPTTSVLASTLTSSNPNVYTLTDTVTGSIQAYPSGTVSFQDTADGNYILGTAALVNGTSSFLLSAKPTVNTTTNYTRFVAVGDVNGDGVPDIVTSLFYGPPGPGVQVFTGNGDGTFNTGAIYTISSQFGPQFVSLADFNNDGCPDILAEAFSANQMALYLNTKASGACTGIFATPTYFSGPGGNYAINGPGGLAVGDFNQDGNLDFVVNNNGTGGNTGTDSVVFFGDGAGGFAAATPIQLAPGGTIVPQYTAVGDFNGDGFLDLAIANSGTDTFNVYLNNGTGGFTLAHTYTTPVPNGIIKAADLNRDGKLDLAISSNQTSTPITIWKGNGDGSFTQQANPAVGSVSIASFSVADFNGDGKPDLIYNTSNSTATGNIYVVLGNGDFTFQAPSTGVSTLGNDTLSLAVGDFNGDGYSDVVVGNYSSNNLGVYLSQYQQTATATLTGVSVSGAAANPHPVDAVFPLNTPYASSTSNTVNLTASVLSDGITLTDLTAPSTAYGQQASFQAVLSPYTSQGYSTNGENVTFYDGSNSIGTAALSSGVATFNTTTLAIGPHSLTATYSTDGNFATATSSPVSHPVTPLADAITVTSPTSPAAVSYTAGGTVPITASSTSGQPLTYSTSSPACTVSSTGVITEVSTGACVVTVSQPAAGNYAAATSQTVTVNIGAGTNIIAFPALPSTAIGATPPVPAATATSGVAPTYTSSTPTVCTVTSSGTITDLAPGTCTITASQAATGNYAAASPVSQSFQVTPLADAITVTSPTSPAAVSYTAGGTVPIAASSTSGQPLTYSTSSPACTVSSTGVITEVSTGACVVTVSQPAAGNYAAATSQTVTVNIGAGTNIIAFPALPSTAIGATPPVPAATATSGVAPTYTSSTPTVCTVTSSGTITDVAPGTCTITASQAATGNYAAATPVSQSFQVTPLADAITVTSPTSPAAVSYTSGGTVPIAASSTSGQPLTYSTSSPACTVSSTGVITEVSTGACVVTVSQPAAGNYAAATSQTVTVNIGAGTNTIAFPALPSTAIGATPPVPAATATSGVAPTYTSSTPSVCTVTSSGTITDLAPGTCTITASQAATGNYAAASPVSQSFQVTQPPDFTIAANAPNSQTVVPGSVVVYTYALAPLGGQYPGANVTYTVTGLPPGATYTLTPASGSVTQSAGPQTLTLTIATAQALAGNRLLRTSPWTLALLLPLFLRRKLRRRLAQSLTLLWVLAAAAFVVTGCAAPNGFFGQPVANYTITVTATSGNVTHSAAPVNLQVQ
jgi:hypothetical protein